MRKESERHYGERIGWLRAAVLGANDGIVSTASLVAGVAAAHVARGDVLIAGIAGLVAGAMSMAAGEYVSVSSQADTEAADLARERRELDADEAFEVQELTDIYVKRGLEPALATQVAVQLMAHDALAAHARDEWDSPRCIPRVPSRPDDRSAPLTKSETITRHTGAALPPPERNIPRPLGASLAQLPIVGFTRVSRFCARRCDFPRTCALSASAGDVHGKPDNLVRTLPSMREHNER